MEEKRWLRDFRSRQGKKANIVAPPSPIRNYTPPRTSSLERRQAAQANKDFAIKPEEKRQINWLEDQFLRRERLEPRMPSFSVAGANQVDQNKTLSIGRSPIKEEYEEILENDMPQRTHAANMSTDNTRFLNEVMRNLKEDEHEMVQDINVKIKEMEDKLVVFKSDKAILNGMKRRYAANQTDKGLLNGIMERENILRLQKREITELLSQVQRLKQLIS
eukprot:TRINITY_DN3531_c0_g1_i2.p2 TRINITY_DN3531_c0_g1~~TRINITY_DN3531_c0_g1_i2.p2  ORF type:complete len:219 (+),score=37.96 TRINITY_DN3531_c0_g1_i2:475-1131(+)